MTSLAAVNSSRFSASATRDGGQIVVQLAGEADGAAKPALEPFLDTVHGVAAHSPGTTVVVDFQSLNFMSSSCFQDFVVWLGRVRDGDHAEQYRIAFLSNQQLHWQRRSLQALGCFAPDQVVVK